MLVANCANQMRTSDHSVRTCSPCMWPTWPGNLSKIFWHRRCHCVATPSRAPCTGIGSGKALEGICSTAPPALQRTPLLRNQTAWKGACQHTKLLLKQRRSVKFGTQHWKQHKLLFKNTSILHWPRGWHTTLENKSRLAGFCLDYLVASGTVSVHVWPRELPDSNGFEVNQIFSFYLPEKTIVPGPAPSFAFILN